MRRRTRPRPRPTSSPRAPPSRSASPRTATPVPGRLDGATALVAVPRDIEALRASDPALAARWRVAVREALDRAGRRRRPDRRLRPGRLVRRAGGTDEARQASSCAGSRCRWSRRSGRRSGPRPRATSCCCASSPTRPRAGASASRWRTRSTPRSTSTRRPTCCGASSSRRSRRPGRVDAHAVGRRSWRRSRATGWPRRRWRWPCSTPSCGPTGRSFARELGAVHDRVPCGVSVGIMDSIPQLLDAVGGYLDEGYVRIKLKIEPGWDVEPVRAVRERFGDDVLLQVDANTAYTLRDARHLAELDAFDLLLIEQPLDEEDVLGHAELARLIRTPICLDESIVSAQSAAAAIRLGACQIVNIKPGRVGGYLEARRIHDVCVAHGVAGVVRRHARDRARPGGQRRPRRAARLHAARRHLGLGPLLPHRHHRAVRPRRRPPRACPTGPGSRRRRRSPRSLDAGHHRRRSGSRSDRVGRRGRLALAYSSSASPTCVGRSQRAPRQPRPGPRRPRGHPARPGRTATPSAADEIGGVVIHDPVDEPVLPPHALVLGVGVDDPDAGRRAARASSGAQRRRRAGRARAGAADRRRSARRPTTPGVALLGLSRGAPWAQLAAMLRSLLAEDDIGVGGAGVARRAARPATCSPWPTPIAVAARRADHHRGPQLAGARLLRPPGRGRPVPGRDDPRPPGAGALRADPHRARRLPRAPPQRPAGRSSSPVPTGSDAFSDAARRDRRARRRRGARLDLGRGAPDRSARSAPRRCATPPSSSPCTCCGCAPVPTCSAGCAPTWSARRWRAAPARATRSTGSGWPASR